MTEKENERLPTYAQNYKVIDHWLLETKNSKQGPYDKKLCNFMPWITSEVMLDDGAQTTTRIRLKGIHQSGRELSEIEIPADELGNFNWMAKHWGINCILEVGQNVKDSLRYAIITAEFPPDIGESGTARYFALELKNGDIDLEDLTDLQREAEKGTLRR